MVLCSEPKRDRRRLSLVSSPSLRLSVSLLSEGTGPIDRLTKADEELLGENPIRYVSNIVSMWVGVRVYTVQTPSILLICVR